MNRKELLKDIQRYNDDTAGNPHQEEPDLRFTKSQFLTLWKNKPDVLTQSDISKMTGYVSTTVRNWIRKGKLRAVTVQGRTLIAKEWLAEFMAGYGIRICHKSEVHLQMMKKALQIE